MTPRRTVQWVDGRGWVVENSSGFTTIDRHLADTVRRQLDRVDPLPCPHADHADLRTSDGDVVRTVCLDCGHTVEPENGATP